MIRDFMLWAETHEFLSTLLTLATAGLFFGFAGMLALIQRRKQHGK